MDNNRASSGRNTLTVIDIQGDTLNSAMSSEAGPLTSSTQKFSLNEKKSPKTITLLAGKFVNPKPGSPEEKIGLPKMTASYELDGKTFKMCINILGNTFPAKIAPARGLVITTYVRGEHTMDEMMTLLPPPTTNTTTKSTTKKSAMPVELAGDLKLLQGQWTNQSGSINFQHETLVIQGDMLVTTAKLARGEGKFAAHIRLDANSSPKAIDFMNPTVGTRTLKTIHGIYELDGDKLTIHRSGIGQPRANVFQNGAAQGNVSVWVRAGSEAAKPGKRPRNAGNTNATRTTAGSGPNDSKALKRAVVGKSTKDYIALTIDGSELRIYADEPHAATYDQAGKRLTNKDAARMLQEGNVIDVDFFVKHPAHPYYLLSEIHLVQGALN